MDRRFRIFAVLALCAALLFCNLSLAEAPLPDEAAAQDAPSIEDTQLSEDALSELVDERLLAEDESESDYLLSPATIAPNGTDCFTLLLVGTDNYRPGTPGRSDTMMLAQVNLKTCEVRLVSFLRDLYVKIPRHGSNRLNAAYVYGGADLLKQTLQSNFGVSFDAYLTVNFSRMVELVDEIGGVDVTITERERGQLNSLLRSYNRSGGHSASDGLLQQSGEVHLSGKQALCYARIRKIDSDFERTARQRKVMEAIFTRVSQMPPTDLIGLIAEAMTSVESDLSAEDVIDLIPLLLGAKDATFQGMQVPLQAAYQSQTISGMAVLVPNLKKNRNAIEEFLAP